MVSTMNTTCVRVWNELTELFLERVVFNARVNDISVIILFYLDSVMRIENEKLYGRTLKLRKDS